ncbi:MAG: acyltransferase [Pseudomonadota bacterium]
MPPARRHDLDWLRVIAFGVLIFFHSAVAFLPNGLPTTMNDTPSAGLSMFVAFSHQFRLGLLFLVSGMGVCFALRGRPARAYLRDRAKRLLIPLAFGILVIVPPMTWLEFRYNGLFEGSYLNFWIGLFSHGTYPEGRLSWHHYWFIAYLFLICLVTLPLFMRWRGTDSVVLWGAWAAQGVRLYTLILPLLVVEFTLRPFFPGFRDLISDWASFSHWLFLFVAGYGLAGAPAALDRARVLRWWSLGIACVSSSFLFAIFWDPIGLHLGPNADWTWEGAGRFFVWSVVRIIAIWCWLLACVGFAGQHLNWPSDLLTKLNRAVYPVFCLHLTVIVWLSTLILPMDWSISAKFLAISFGTCGVLWLLYMTVVIRLGRFGILVGAKP